MDGYTLAYVHINASRHLPVEKTIGPTESVFHVDSQESLEFRDWTTKSPSVGAKETRERPGLSLEARRRKRGRSWSPSCIDNFSFAAFFLLFFSSLFPFLLAFSLLSLLSALLTFFCARECSFRRYITAPSWVATSTAVPGSTTRTNIKPETAIRRPEYGKQLTPDIPLRGRRMRRF